MRTPLEAKRPANNGCFWASFAAPQAANQTEPMVAAANAEIVIGPVNPNCIYENGARIAAAQRVAAVAGKEPWTFLDWLASRDVEDVLTTTTRTLIRVYRSILSSLEPC